MSRFLFVAAFCAALMSASFVSKVSAQQEPSICDSLKGAAYGMCKAAAAVGCDGSLTAPAGCGVIEKNFNQITGQTPPWTLPDCPCGTVPELVDIIGTAEVSCTVGDFAPDPTTTQLGVSVDDSIKGDNIFFTVSVRDTKTGALGKQTCGFANTSLYDIKDAQFESCYLSMQSAAESAGATCVAP